MGIYIGKVAEHIVLNAIKERKFLQEISPPGKGSTNLFQEWETTESVHEKECGMRQRYFLLKRYVMQQTFLKLLGFFEENLR